MEEQELARIGEIDTSHLHNMSKMISFGSLYETEYFEYHKGDDKYELVDYYCKNPDCDCTSVRFEVMLNGKKNGAVVWYDYEKSILDEPSNYAFLVEEIKKSEEDLDDMLCMRHDIIKLEVESLYYKSETEKLKEKIKQAKEEERQLKEEIEQLKAEYYEKNPSQKTVRNDNKIRRNDPCPCGSGKKYKKCCLI